MKKTSVHARVYEPLKRLENNISDFETIERFAIRQVLAAGSRGMQVDEIYLDMARTALQRYSTARDPLKVTNVWP